MNLLIIEDIDFRQNFIKSKLEILAFDTIDCADNSDTATHFLKENIYDIVFFDYDLVGAKKSKHIVKEWFENRDAYATQSPIIFIHSMNMAGADLLENYLKGFCKSLHRVPFKFIATEKVDILEMVKNSLSES